MDIPDPDPQHAPLHEVHLFEILRHRYLEQARAVANIDVYAPYIEQDRLHIEHIQHPNLVPLKAIGLGHKSAMVLRRMDQ